MTNKHLLDLRDEKNVLIDRKLSSEAYNLSLKDINFISNLPWFKKIPHNYLFLMTINKIIYKKYYISVTQNFLKNHEIDKNSIYKFNPLKINYFKNIIKKILFFFKQCGHFFIYNQTFNKNNISICFVEGINKDSTSDFYWINKDLKILKSEIIVYLVKDNYFNRYKDNRLEIKKIQKQGFKIIDINRFYIKKYKCDDIDYITNILKNVYPNSIIEHWVKNFIFSQLNEINFWYSFFKQTNTKIHLDITEAGLSNINKSMALNFLNSISLGKERSIFTQNYPQGALSYYPNDIFFVWGKRSQQIYLNSFNIKNNVVVVGHPTMSKRLFNVMSNDTHLNNFTKNFKYKILIIDNMHSYNRSLHGQNIYTPFMMKFLDFFINLTKNDSNFGILLKIKSEKNLKNLQKEIKFLKESNKFILLNNPVNTDPYMFTRFCDLSISINVHLSTSIIENAICGHRAIHYDFANTENYERDLYDVGRDKLIFNNFDIFKKELINYFDNDCMDLEFGNWEKIISKFDEFRDFNGCNRIANYITDLKKSFDKGLNKNSSIEFANNNFMTKYGNDKIEKVKDY